MAGYFKNRVVWITGASSGIGEALTYELAELGARLILSSRRKEALEKVKGNCPPAAQPHIRILPLDLTDPSTFHLSSQAAIQFFGTVDILIHNGGVGQRSLAKNTLAEVDRRIMEVDYFGAVGLTKAILPHFLERKAGHFVVVSSVMGKIGTPWRSGYAAAKHALHGYFDSLRAELWNESRKLKVTMICPGWIRTNNSMNMLTADMTPLKEPVGRGGIPVNIFARKMISAIRHQKTEVIIGGYKETNAVRMFTYFPAWFHRMVRKANTMRN